MAVTQENRKIQVVTPLGKDDLLFYQMHGRESLNEPFEYQLELLSVKPDIDPAQLLGKNITVSLQLTDGSWRYFNGCVTRFGQYGNLNVFHYYRATLRPWLWFLTRASNCRIFQNKTAPDIIKQVFRDQGFSDFKEKLSGSYATREYCVQYRETDFNFVSRLMEEEGICYHFSHEKEKHTLVLADSNAAHDKFPGYEKIPYHVETGTTDRSRTDHIREWGYSQEVQPGLYELTDYDFKKPKANLLVKSNISESHTSHAKHEFFDYPGRYTETGAGDNFVRQRIEEHHARFERCEGKGNARGLTAGYRFALEDFPRKDQNQEYLVVSADYHLLLDEYFSQTSGSAGSNIFECSFTALENKRPYRPIRNTPKPLVQGAQTAVVMGPSGDEIYTDKYGRVKVHFHWDRKDRWEDGKKDEDSSCWVRVAHPWAGKQWGMVAIPRMGHEVVVEFLEGDPDQPLIVGSVYNADNMPPYALPANATQTGIKSRSSKGGGADNFNEIRFEDKKGSEEMYIHAEKNQNSIVENDQTITVGNDRKEDIGRDRSLEVGRHKNEKVAVHKTIEVGGSHNESIQGDMTQTVFSTKSETIALLKALSIGGAYQVSVGLAMNESVGGSKTEEIGGFKGEGIGGSKSETIGDSKTVSTGKDLILTIGNNKTVTVTKDLNETVGGKHLEQVTKDYALNAKNIQLMAEDKIVFKTGDAEITLKKNGDITISGKKISIKGSGDIIIKGSKILEN